MGGNGKSRMEGKWTIGNEGPTGRGGAEGGDGGGGGGG